MNKILPKSFEEFEQKEYWDKFFRKLKKNSDLEYFEWYGEYPNFRSIVKKYLKSSDQILNIGCGKSLMSEQMYDDGYENLVNIDFSEKVIEGKVFFLQDSHNLYRDETQIQGQKTQNGL